MKIARLARKGLKAFVADKRERAIVINKLIREKPEDNTIIINAYCGRYGKCTLRFETCGEYITELAGIR